MLHDNFLFVRVELIKFYYFYIFFSLPFFHPLLSLSLYVIRLYPLVIFNVYYAQFWGYIHSKHKPNKKKLCRSQSQLDNSSKRDTGVSSASVRNQSSTVSSNLIRMPSAPSHTAEETRLLG